VKIERLLSICLEKRSRREMKGYLSRKVTTIVAVGLLVVNGLGANLVLDYGTSRVKNILLLIGDGMGLTQVAAARIKALGAEGRLYIERMPVTGLINVHSADKLITDSGAASTALATGYKTRNGMIGVNPEGKRLLTILEAARNKGMATGLVVTSTITHATPAAFAAHVKSRYDELTIAVQMLENKVNVMMGGGRAYFLPKELGGKRRDGRNLIEEAKAIGYTYVETKDGLQAADGEYLLGLFQMEALTTTASEEPRLAEMTAKAIEILSRNENGFFLMVEGSQIDWACHRNNPYETIRQTLLFDEAVKVVLEFATRDTSTLVVVTADHECGGMAINGGSLDGRNLEIGWTTGGHTGVPVPIFAHGPGAGYFTGLHDNTEIPRIFAKLLGIEGFPHVCE